MPSFDSFEAHVTLEAETSIDLTEYSITVDQAAKTVTCWVPSEVGKNFSVVVKNIAPRSFDWSAKVDVDGMYIRCPIGSRAPGKIICRGQGSTLTSEKRLMFSALESTDDDEYMHMDIPKDLGDICVTITSIVLGSSRGNDLYTPSPTLGKIHERLKKAVAHHVQLGDAIPVVKRNLLNAVDIEQLAKFVFKYRPLSVLQADGIAPHNPQKEPPPEPTMKAPEKRKAPSMEDEQVKVEGDEIETELSALRKRISELEDAKRRGSQAPQSKRIKTESRPPTICKEVIDLT